MKNGNSRHDTADSHESVIPDVGFVTDEIASDLRTALGTGLSWGVRKYELRCAGGRRFPYFDKSDHDLLKDMLRNEELRITAVSPGIFKRGCGERYEIKKELSDILPRSIDSALELGVHIIIAFGFIRETDQPGEHRPAVEHMIRAGEMCAKSGIMLAIENEPGYHCDSGSATADFLRAVDHPSVRANWDAANCVGTGERPFPEGYEALKEFIVNAHVKDTTEGALIRCLPVGEGTVDWQGQLAALARDGILGHVTIETHCEPLLEMSRKNLATIHRMLESR